MNVEPRAPHAPEVSGVGRLAGRLHVTGAFWYRLHLFGVRKCPRFVFPPLIFAFTLFFLLFLRRIGAAIQSNLEVVLGPAGFLERQRRVFRTFHQFAWCLTERYEHLSRETHFDMRVDGIEHWHTAIADGRGVVFVTAHIGNWEVGSALPASEQRRHVHLVREEEMNPEAQRLIERLLRERMGDGYTTHFARRDPTLGVKLLDALSRGDVVALQGDRPRTGGRTCRAQLFGRDFDLPQGPIALARSAGVTLLPVFVIRTGRGAYTVQLQAPVEVRSDDDDRRTALDRAARRLAQAIEKAIREAPHQWFCFRRIWNERGAYDAGPTPPRR